MKYVNIHYINNKTGLIHHGTRIFSLKVALQACKLLNENLGPEFYHWCK